VQAVSGDLDEVQGTLRAGPSAVLASQIVVGEGKTEIGVARRFLQHWDAGREPQGKAPHAALGVCLTNGLGSTVAPRRAEVLADLGYAVLLVVDNDDRNSDPGVIAATVAGAEIIRWEPGHAIEDEIIASLRDDGLAELVGLAAEIKGEQSILSAVGNRLRGEPKLAGLDPSAWVDDLHSIEEVRAAIAAAAQSKNNPWFKTEESAEQLGGLLTKRWDEIAASPLGVRLAKLYRFAYGEDLA
jgi:putative ATP-dependent endonuclease of the OLD family